MIEHDNLRTIVIDWIEQQPTAYDIDEKIKQIEALKARPWTDEAAFRAYNLAIQIVRGEQE